MIIKVVGMMIIVFAGWIYGYILNAPMYIKAKSIKEITNALVELKNQIEYYSNNIFVAIKNSKKNTSKAVMDFFSAIKSDSSDCDFCELWSTSLNRYIRAMELGQEEKGCLIDLGNRLGKTEIHGQIEALERCIEKLKVHLYENEIRIKKYSKLYRWGGLAVGVLISIILI